jgi:hypothetical protein
VHKLKINDMKKITFAILLSLSIFSCEKENDSTFSGITVRDSYGNSSGNIDGTDWKFDDVWNEKEEKLFDSSIETTTTSNIFNDVPPIDHIIDSKCIAYPNPAKENLVLKFESDADRIKFVLVDFNYDIILSSESNGGNATWILNLTDRNIIKLNTLYRVYYKLYYTDNEAERGHGDIMMIN